MTPPKDRFAELFSRTHLPLLAYALRRVSVPADAADVVAETFLVAWRRLDDVPDGDAARSWLFGVARRVLANHRRGEQRRHALADRLRAELAACVPAPQLPEPNRLDLALQQLSETDRELLRLLAWEGLSPAEIAVVLGIEPGTARVRLTRARARLAKALDELTDDPVKRERPTGHVRVTTTGSILEG